MIAIEGRENILGSVWADGEIEAIYAGDVLIWPDVSGQGGIMIEPPARGTMEYLYWVHAVDAAVNDAGSYLKFTIGGVDYYINKAPNGAQLVLLEGNVLKLSKEQSEALAGKLGRELQVYAEVKERKNEWRKFTDNNDVDNRFSYVWYLPLLPGSKFAVSCSKGRKNEWAYVRFYAIESLGSGMEIDIDSTQAATSSGRYTFEFTSREVRADEVVLTDSACRFDFNTYGSAGCNQGVTPVWPAFDYIFSVNIISIF